MSNIIYTKQDLGWGWNTEQTTLDLVDYAKDLERQLAEAREVLCEYIERRERCNSEVCMNSLYDLRDQLKEEEG